MFRTNTLIAFKHLTITILAQRSHLQRRKSECAMISSCLQQFAKSKDNRCVVRKIYLLYFSTVMHLNIRQTGDVLRLKNVNWNYSWSWS